jgi:UDP-2,3-diacylglucosamine hydrolase
LKSPEAAPPIGALAADGAWRAIDLLSDVHLRADRPRTFDAWRDHLLHTTADAVLILGDLFEAWVGDDARGEGFDAECLAVLRATAAQRLLAFMPGNRDFLVGDVMLGESGVQRLADPTLLTAWGGRWLLTHGDALCLADADYLRFRAEVRTSAWQQAFLARPLAERRALARTMRDASMAHQAGISEFADVDSDAAAAWLAAAGTGVLIHGHTHRPGRHALPGGGIRLVLGDWEFDTLPRRAQALRLTPQGLAPLDLAA